MYQDNMSLVKVAVGGGVVCMNEMSFPSSS